MRSLPQHLIETAPTVGWRRRHLGFITDENQINVALTRAKKGLIIIGKLTQHKKHIPIVHVETCPVNQNS